MDTVQDFEDFLELLDRHAVRYLIIGGLAFIFHAKPRFTKDIDVWLDPVPEYLGSPSRTSWRSRSASTTRGTAKTLASCAS